MEEPQIQNVKRRRVESEECRSLYLCTEQIAEDGLRYNVHAINLADLLSCSCKIHVQPPTVYRGDELVTTKVCDLCSSGAGQLPLLRDLASIHDENLCYSPGCGVFGSQIIFAGGLEPGERRRGPSRTASKKIYVFETDSSVDSNPSIKPLSESSRRIIPGEFIGNKTQPFMVEFNGDDGKKDLYALSGYPFPLCFPPTFEVLYGTSKEWVTLPDVPFFYRRCPYFSYAVVGTKILVSSLETPVSCFDVAEKETKRQHWRELSFFNGKDFPFAGTALVLDLDDSDDEKLMFAYQETAEEYSLWNLAAYRVCMTEKSESVELLGSNLIPPDQLPLQFRNNVFCQYRLLDLGGGNVCLVVGSDYPPMDDDDSPPRDRPPRDDETYGQRSAMHFLVIRFHYFFSRRNNSISVDILASHIFEYDFSCYTVIAEMVGCFLIAKPTLESECHPWTRE
ncbi:unnamed protein product [Malus baccata var. baccata]